MALVVETAGRAVQTAANPGETGARFTVRVGKEPARPLQRRRRAVQAAHKVRAPASLATSAPWVGRAVGVRPNVKAVVSVGGPGRALSRISAPISVPISILRFIRMTLVFRRW